MFYSVYVKINKAWGYTCGWDTDIKAGSLQEAAKKGKELVPLDKGDRIVYIEVANTEKEEPITFFDPDLNMTKEM